MRTAKTLIRLGRCPGWSESLLGAHAFCWFCHVAAQIDKTKTTVTEHEHDKTYKMTCTEQFISICLALQSDKCLCCLHEEALGPSLATQKVPSGDWSDYTICRLIWVFCGIQMWFLKILLCPGLTVRFSLSRIVTKPTKWVCAQRRLRSAWASTQSDQSLHCAFNG